MINRMHQVFILVGARVYEVTAIFRDDASANAHIAVHPDEGVIAVDEKGLIFLAKLADKGRKS